MPAIDYPGDMDPACVGPCDALNAIPGIATIESCEGHGARPPAIWLGVDARAVPAVLPLLAELVSSNYRGLPFRLLVEDTGDGRGRERGSLVLCLEGTRRGRVAMGDLAALELAIEKDLAR